MKATAIIPVKHFGAAKRRLGPDLDQALRRGLVERMLADVLGALSRSAGLERAIVVSGEPGAAQLADEHGYELLDDPADAGHSEAAALGIARALELGADCVALLPGDCPMLDEMELDELLSRVESPSVTVVPDRHGAGTNGLVLAPPQAIEPAFGPGSCARHAKLAEAAGVPHTIEQVPSLALDIDTPEDLALWRQTS